MFISEAFAQTAAPAAAPVGSFLTSGIVPMAIFGAVIFFFMIRPQMKKQKEHKALIDALAKGDEVIVGGIVGRVAKVSDQYLDLEIAKGVEIQVQRSAVFQVLPKGTLKF